MKCQQKKSLNCVRLKVKDCNALSWAHDQSNLLFLLLPAFLGRSEKKSYAELNIEAARFDIKLMSPEINIYNQL